MVSTQVKVKKVKAVEVKPKEKIAVYNEITKNNNVVIKKLTKSRF